MFIKPRHRYDSGLLLSSAALLLLGLVMVASTSINIAQTRFNDPLHYFWRQAGYVSASIVLAIFALQIPIRVWQRLSVPLLLMGLCSLVLVVLPEIGHEVNGSMRWLSLGFISVQPSEFIKLFMILYLAGYLIRRSQEVREALSGFVKPIAVVCVITSLLLIEPDYGATVVLFITTLGMLFLAGVPMRQFVLWVIVVTFALSILIIIAPYRVGRLTAFMNPWADPFNTGFQLTQALIAIGRGELFGVGLGSSVQKLTYLPEAHTDFLFAILAEELGLVGVIIVIGLFAYIILKAFTIAIQSERLIDQLALEKQLQLKTERNHQAVRRDNSLQDRSATSLYAAYLAYGIGLSIGLQVSINLGVNMGLLPTKGLTLPLMSYGGSSMVVTCLMLALLIRIDYENRRG